MIINKRQNVTEERMRGSLRPNPCTCVTFSHPLTQGLNSILTSCGITLSRGFPPSLSNTELVTKFHVAQTASHAALPILTSKFRPKVTLC